MPRSDATSPNSQPLSAQNFVHLVDPDRFAARLVEFAAHCEITTAASVPA